MSIAFDPSPLAIAGKLAEFATILVGMLAEAGKKTGTTFNQIAVGHMVFKNPTGEFEGSLQIVQNGPFETEVGSDLPYGPRLEWGFYGTDSLGRHYDEAGYGFMQATLYDSALTAQAALDYLAALEAAWNAVAGNAAMAAIAVMEG